MANPLFTNPFQNIYAGSKVASPVSLESQMFQPAQSTDDLFSEFYPSSEQSYIPTSSGVIGRPNAQNTAQAGMSGSNEMIRKQGDLDNKNYFGQALEAITSLNKKFGFDVGRGGPVPIAGGRGLMQNMGLNGVPYETFRASPSEYNTIEGRTLKGSEIPKETLSFGISPEMKASQAALPRLDVPEKGLVKTEDNNPNTTLYGMKSRNY